MKDDTRDEEGYLKPQHWPQTLDAAVEMVIASMDEESRRVVANPDTQEGAWLHMSLGLWIRNQFGLWKRNDALKHSCAVSVAKAAGCSPEALAELESRLEADGKRAWRVYLLETAEKQTERSRWMLEALMAADDADSASAVIIDATTKRLQQSSITNQSG